MKTKSTFWNKLLFSAFLAGAATPLITIAALSTNVGYVQKNIVSDLTSNATYLDPRLVNPWGIIASPDFVWINDNGPGLTTVYGPFGRPMKFPPRTARLWPGTIR